NPIEEGEGYHQLADEFGLTQQQIAETVGKDRTTISNMVRLLQLPDQARRLLQEGHLTMGHAKVLLGLEDAEKIVELALAIVAEGLTVREVERRLRDVAGPREGKKAGRPRTVDRQPAEAKRIEDRLRRFLQTDVVLRVGADNSGVLSVQFYSADDLQRLLERIGVPD
ncbi:MAG: ParB/RepB/Spo0J family partition protein, partial [Gemmatimonadaceae bacterium]